MARGRQISRLRLLELSPGEREGYLNEWDAKSLHFDKNTFPSLNSEALFGNARPLEVEIGPGTGEYLCDLAESNPGINYLGIEASKRAVYYAVRIAASKELKNIRIIRANVKLLYDLVPQGSWRKVYLHFPDPVHKRKDEKHRVFDQDFLDFLDEALERTGEISVVSDKGDFLMEMQQLAAIDERFEFAHEQSHLDGFEPGRRSRFQKFWEGKGIEPKRFILRKI